MIWALGGNTPFFRLFYLIPGVSLFRAPSLIIFLYGLSIATLGALSVTDYEMNLLDYVPCYRSEAGTGNAMAFATWQ